MRRAICFRASIRAWSRSFSRSAQAGWWPCRPQQDLQGPLAEDISKYYQAARAEAFDRIPLFRLAWDASISAFAGRQVLYERFFFGDPVRMAGALVAGHDPQIQQCAERCVSS